MSTTGCLLWGPGGPCTLLPQTLFKVNKIKGLRRHQRQAFSYDSIRQLFQNILDLVFIVEHTYQGKVLHTQLQIIFWEKSCKKNKTATALVMQS